MGGRGSWRCGIVLRRGTLTSLKTLKKRYGSFDMLRSRSESKELFVDCLGW